MNNLFSQNLLQWFDQHGRKNLPWQQNINPYRVWVSEIMLQQTQVSTVIPYYLEFMQRFSNVIALANAPLDDVLNLWTGLGYYARARNLHRTAQIIATQYSNQFPAALSELVSLPGIGRSTAGAILSIAFGKPTAILDGNVKRVLSRYHAIEEPLQNKNVEAHLWTLAQTYTCQKRPQDYTQAIMDLGATICTRTKPTCSQCPLSDSCEAHQQQREHEFPVVVKKKTIPTKKTFFIIFYDKDQNILLEKRPPTGIWGGLWSFPECPNNEDIRTWCQNKFPYTFDEIKSDTHFRHTFSHFHLEITPIYLKIKQKKLIMMDSDSYVWYNFEQTNQLGLATPVKRLISQLKTKLRI